MPQIEFDGKGDPIPTLALPPFGADGNLPPAVLTFMNSADFKVSDYRALGFTHYEAWCVGAAGGRGGDATTVVSQPVVLSQQPVSQDVWNLGLEATRIEDFYTTGEWDHVYAWGLPGPNGTGLATMADYRNWENPNHMMTFQTYAAPFLFPDVESMGGGGGGGGFQKVNGVLADLPDSVPVIVGKVGVDAPYGQIDANGPFTPNPVAYIPQDTTLPYPRGRLNEIQNYLIPYSRSYPLPHPSFDNPTPGGDGGTSSFGDVGQASGGKGGDPGMIWDGAKFVVNGKGGDGGIGGSLLPGGGGAGSAVEGVNGADGVWDPEAGIGGGGGGGKGGLHDTTTGFPMPGFSGQTVVHHFATAGGQGSYSFGDTSVYGPRQFRQPWTYLKPVFQPNGTVTYTPTTEANTLVIPGGGGGARPNTSVKAGSKAPGFSPDGVVVLRLAQITA